MAAVQQDWRALNKYASDEFQKLHKKLMPPKARANHGEEGHPKSAYGQYQ